MSEAELLALAKKSAENDLPFLLASKEKARQAHKENPTAETMRLFNLAKTAYDAELSKVERGGISGPVSESLGKLPAVEKYLSAAGWKVKKSKLYQDKKKGLLKMQPDGTVLKSDADAYAAVNLAPADAAPDADDQETLRLKREQLRMDLEIKRQVQERGLMRLQKERGELVPREEVDQILVSAVTVLRSSLRQWLYVNMGELVELVAGDPAKIEPAIHFWLNASNEFFNGFSRRREFEVEDDGEPEPPVPANDDEDAA